MLGNIIWVCDIPTQVVIVLQNSLDHNLIALPFVASEDAETMDEVFRGTEEEIERMPAILSNHAL